MAVLQDACDAGTLSECAPSILSGVCGMCGNGGGLLASFIAADELETICTSCEFLDCCDRGEGFDVCGESLPEEVLTGVVATPGVAPAVTTTAVTETTTAASTTVTAATSSAVTTSSPETTSSVESTSSAEETSTTSTEASIQSSTTFALIEEAETEEAQTEEAQTEEEETFDSTGSGIDDFWGDISGQFNESFTNETDDFFGGLFGNDGSESGEGSDDFLGGLFGGSSSESGAQGPTGFLEGIGDFIDSLFGSGSEVGDMNFTYEDDFNWETVFNETGDDFFGNILGGGLNSSEGLGSILSDLNLTEDDDFDWDALFNETDDDFFGSILGEGFNSSEGMGGGLSDLVGDLLESVDGFLGDWSGENGTEWIDKGNFSGWGQDDFFVSSMVCAEDNTCPVAGFCDCMNGDLSKCSLTMLDDVCSSGAMFSCAPDDFEEMCNTDCPPPPRRLQGGNAVVTATETESYSSANCLMCQVARCCETEDSTMSECAMEAGIDPQAVLNLTDIGNTLEDFVDEVLNNLTGVIDDLIGNITIPEFCPSGSCPVDGFCECVQGDFMQCNEQVLREACEANAIFGECGPTDFETFCSTECDGEMESMQDMVNMALCSMCTIATCCQEQGSADECLFGGASFPNNSALEFVTDTSGAYEGSQSDSKEETDVDSTEAQTDVADEETALDESVEPATEDDEVETVASATAEEDGSSSAPKLVFTMVYGILSVLVLAFTF
jgi:hypothetical protein